MQQRIILHLDMDSFYASVEMQAHPDLRGKPVVIGADPKHGRGRGVVSTCSYEARAYGIRSAMPVSQAYVLCPHAIFRPPDFPLYAAASGQVMAVLRSCNFPFQQVSIDEAFLDISSLASYHEAADLAGRIRAAIDRKCGLTCSVGIAQSKLVAKIASDFQKPAGLTVVEPAATRQFLAPLPVRKMPGIGKKAELALLELGIRSIGEIASCDTRRLVSRFGRVGAAMHDMATGIDESEVKERTASVSLSRETTFESDTDSTGVLVSTLDSLIGDIQEELACRELRFRTLTLKIRYQGFVTRTRSRTLSHHTGKKEILHSSAHALLREMLEERKVRLLGIRLSSFEKPDRCQTTLCL